VTQVDLSLRLFVGGKSPTEISLWRNGQLPAQIQNPAKLLTQQQD
jgi:hypothetical protein